MTIRRAKRLTLKEIANKLGVSTATVSNAFNRPSQLSLELREEILQSCKQMGYAGPNAESRQLRTNKTKVIAVILTEHLSYGFSDPVTSSVLQGISEVVEAYQYNMLIVPSGPDARNISGLESFVEGFIIYGPPSQEHIDELSYHRKAISAIDFSLEKGVSININNREAARECADLALCHHPQSVVILGLKLVKETKIINLARATLCEASTNIMVQRLLGFEEAALSHNISIPKQNIWSLPQNTHFYAYETARYVLKQSPKPQLILCMSDQIALGAIQAATELGLSIPNDILITGFDGIDEGKASSPTLTTIEQPSLEKGRAAAEIFFGQREEKNLILQAPLFIGESCPTKDKANL